MTWLPADLPAWLGFWCDGLLRASLEGGAALGIAWAAGALFPRMPATVRCWLWRLAYVKLLFALVIAGPIQLRVLPAGSTPLPRTTYYAAPAAEPESRPAASTSPEAPAPVSAATSGGISLLLSGIFALWLIGVGWSILRVLREVREARRLYASSREVEEPWIVERCAELAFLFHLRRLPRLLAAEGRGSPLLVLSGGPAVLLPASLLRDYAPEDVELMLAHELAHLKRGDLLWSWLPAVAHWLFFFHPVVWLANREWRLAHEMACDELALEITTAAPGEYGQVLVRVAAQSRLNLQTGLATVGLEETPETLKRRLAAMKHPRHVSPLRVAAFSLPVMLVGSAALLPWRLAAADAGVAPVGRPLRYGWQAGRSYSYQVTVDGETDSYRERHSGTITYTAARRGESVVLAHSGTLFPHRTPKEPGVFSPLTHLRPFSFGLGPDAGSGHVRIEARGRILEQREGTALPYSLGAIGRMILEPLPEGEAAGWEVSGDREILVEEEEAARPGSFFRRSSQIRLAGRERGRYTVEKADTATAVIRKAYELRTIEEHGGAPRLRLSGEGRLTWDRMQDVPRALEFAGTLTESSESLTRRTPVTLRYTLQESPAGSPSVPPPAGSATDTAALLRDLRAGTATERQGAASRLAGLPADPAEKPRVAAALRPLLRDKQPFTRLFAARALKSWGARADSPSLLPLLKDPESSVRWAAVETVGALGHPDGLRALAEMVAEDRDRFFASRALRTAGTAAEPAVLGLLASGDEATSTEACRILEEIGGARSLEPLRQAAGASSPALRAAAEQARAAVERRLGS